MNGQALEASPSTIVSGAEGQALEPRMGILAALVGVAALAAMAAGAIGPFIFDDIPLIEGNTYIQSFEHWPRWFTKTLWDSNYDPSFAADTRGFWRPWVLASYAINWWLGSGSPLVFHATNLLIHALNAVLLLHVLARWVPSLFAACAGAVLFAVHPVQTEPVVWIAGRTDSLCTLGLLVLTLGVRTQPRQRALGSTLVALGLCIAFGSKEAAVVAPVLVAIELWSVDKPALDAAFVKRTLRAVWPYLLLSLVYMALHRLYVFRGSSRVGLTAGNHPWLVLEAWGRYSALLLWPNDLTLGRALLPFKAEVIVPHRAYAAFGGLVLSGLGLLAWRLRTRKPALVLGVLAWLGMLLPVSGLVWLGNDVLVSPRYMYVPLLGASLAFAALLAAGVGQKPWLRGLAAIALVVLCTRSFARAADFDSEQAFWKQEITHNPNYVHAQSYFLYRELNAGRPRAALGLAHHWFQLAEASPVPEIHKGALILGVLAATLPVIPDIDADSLGRVQRFASALARKEAGELTLPSLGLSLSVPARSRLFATFKVHEQRLWLMAAEAGVRSGDDAGAAQAVQSALAGCDDCWTLLANGALVLARARRVPEALELAERALERAPPGKIPDIVRMVREAQTWERRLEQQPSALAEAGFHSALGSFGRAYRAARPALQAPALGARDAVSLAELAFRAGDVNTARRLLGGALPPEQAAQRLTELASSVPWLDRPRPDDDWLPESPSR